jgi:AraC-like DNA-binding protein
VINNQVGRRGGDAQADGAGLPPGPAVAGWAGSGDAGVVPIDEAVAARPRGPLRAAVAEHHGYHQRGLAPAVHRGLPSPWLTLIFTLHEPLSIAQHVDPRQPPDEYEALIGGLHARPALIRHQGAQSGVQVQVSPLAARALLGVPAGELAGIDVHAVDVLGRVADRVSIRLGESRGWSERFAVLDELLGAVLVDDRPPAEVERAWQLLVHSGGTARIDAIAREVGWSERHLGVQFRREIGLTPKVAARVIRFDRARRLLPGRAGAEVAARCGYADQSHLARDFIAFAGLSPGAWMQAEVRNVQDHGRESGARSSP